jgi:hypothetical protein
METVSEESRQDELASDASGMILKSVRDKLAEMRATLRRLKDAGAAPQEYAVAEKLLAAVDAAEEVDLAFWEKHNK